MDAIEIFFVFYGALLALSVAKILSGVTRLARHRGRIGWLTPLLILLLLFDLASFVNSAWRELGAADAGMRLVVACLGAASAYYVAGSMVVPERLAEGDDLDDHYLATKRFTVGGLLVANLLGSQLVQMMVRGLPDFLAARWNGFSGVMNLVFYGLLATLLIIRRRAPSIVMLATLNAIFVLVLLVF